jgi:hypothetical protein
LENLNSYYFAVAFTHKKLLKLLLKAIKGTFPD